MSKKFKLIEQKDVSDRALHIRSQLANARHLCSPKLSMEKLAKAIGGKNASTWQHYETKFNKDYLPIDIANKVAPLFAQHGVDPQLIYDLTGTKLATVGPNLPILPLKVSSDQSGGSIFDEVQKIADQLDHLEKRIFDLRTRLGVKKAV